MLDALQDLLNASRRVGLAVELARDDVLEQLAAGDQVEDEVVETLLLIKFSGFNKIWFPNEHLKNIAVFKDCNSLKPFFNLILIKV